MEFRDSFGYVLATLMALAIFGWRYNAWVAEQERKNHTDGFLSLFDHPAHVSRFAGNGAQIDIEVSCAGLRLLPGPTVYRAGFLVLDCLLYSFESGVDSLSNEYHCRPPFFSFLSTLVLFLSPLRLHRDAQAPECRHQPGGIRTL